MENSCASCNQGYQLEGQTCEMFECSPTPGAGCASCQNPLIASQDFECLSCNTGYDLEGANCVGYPCVTGSGTGCGSCPNSQSNILAPNYCATCNSGYFLSSGQCIAYTCSTGGGSGCGSCVAQSQMTKDNQCGSCNAGYYLVSGNCVQKTCGNQGYGFTNNNAYVAYPGSKTCVNCQSECFLAKTCGNQNVACNGGKTPKSNFQSVACTDCSTNSAQCCDAPVSNKCTGWCGNYNSVNWCWCDTACLSYGDCCDWSINQGQTFKDACNAANSCNPNYMVSSCS